MRLLRIYPVLSVSCALFGQTHVRSDNTRLDDAAKEITQLKRLVSEQDQRIANLERTVKSLQATLVAAARPAPPVSWRTAEGWAAVKTGMSRAQVVEILGEPHSADAVMDRQTLFYKDGANPVGSVILVDDRVSEVTSPRFRINIPSQQ